jgi:predicted Zn-dependent peptidase
MSYKKTTLPNGIRVVTERMEGVRSVSLGVCITSGSRDENENEKGVSHLIEHMLFKGTETRTAKDIAVAIESIGGVLNAFTAKEFTYYYARFLDKHLNSVWELLTDVLEHPKFEEKALIKEKAVILEEIQSFEDSPEEQALHGLTKILFKNHPLAHPITGTKTELNSLSRDDMLRFRNLHYTGDNLIVAASGHLAHEKLVELVNSSLSPYDNQGKKNGQPPAKSSPEIKIKTRKDLSQVRVTLGRRTMKYDSKERMPLLVLNTLLGDGMSSRLFQRLREEEAKVYTIFSYLELFKDTGLLGVYLATSKKHLKSVTNNIFEELTKLRNQGVNQEELKNTKEQLKGELLLGLESTANRMVRLTKDEVYLSRYVSLDEVISSIDTVKEEDIASLAERFLEPSDYSISIVGPIKNFSL